MAGGRKEMISHGTGSKNPYFPLKPLKGSEILQPIWKTIRTGNSANGSQLLVFHSLASCNVTVSPCEEDFQAIQHLSF